MGRRKKKVLAIVLASMTGLSVVTATSSIIAYEAMFPRYNRPNYALTSGEYYYERVKERLPRSEFYYPGVEGRLKGYYYESLQNKGLVIVVHGMHAGGDDYLPIIEYMVQSGYNVFSYDSTGTYDSEGDDTVGMCQALIDLRKTIEYVKSISSFSTMPLYLIGHSWGGYAVGSVLEFCKEVKACATIAGMNNGSTMMVEKAEEYVGKLAMLPKPVFDGYQRILFGDYVECSAVKGINSVNIPVLVAHGKEDKVIRFDKQSIIAKRAEITNPNVAYYIGEGLQGDHNNIWHSKESAYYQKQVEKELKNLQKAKGEKLTDEEKANFYKTVDHRLYSEVNKELMQKIVDMFSSAK